YSAALLLSLSHVVVLFWLCSPDLGLMIGNYLGYWLMGSSLIAVGMLASLLTANATIAFILGALFCAFFTFIDGLGGLVSPGLANWLKPLGLTDHFGDFARGIVSFSGLLYFFSLTGLFLYFNVTLISRRHWPQRADGFDMKLHHLVRGIALVLALISANAIVGRLAWRADVTAEQLHSLSEETETLLTNLPEDRTVFIQAFLSEEVPQGYVQVRENLVGFLKEIDAVAGSRVEVLIHDTEPYTDEARDAREKFGINPVELADPANPRGGAVPVFMGLAFTCGAQEEVIPFLEPGLPVEYELVRSIRIAARAERKKVGLLATEAKLFGGFDFQSGSTAQPWPVVAELEKQYEVVRITATAPITEELDGLIVPMPSTLPQEEMNHLLDYIEGGTPTLLMVDPLPVVNLGIAPSEKAGANRNPFMQNSGPQPKEKGDINAFMNRLGISWNIQQVVWDSYNPHPELATLPPEIVFVGRGNQNPETFNMENAASKPLEELVLLFPGYLGKAPGANITFTPLIESGAQSGLQQYSNMVRRSFFGAQLVTRGLPHFPSAVDYTLAARVSGGASADTSMASKKTDLIVIADIDFIS
nr:GldG family protein [Calditrichia bacterium]